MPKVQKEIKDSYEQFTITLPVNLARAYGLDGGEEVSWQALTQDALRMDIEREDDE